MTWFMDPMPDGDRVRVISTTLRTAHETYKTAATATQNEVDATRQMWQSRISDEHAAVTARTQAAADAHLQWLVATADVLDTISEILKIIGYLQMIWLAIQAGSAILAFFTAGASEVDGQIAAAETEGAIQVSRFSVEAILKAAFKAMLDHLLQVAGTLIGGGIGAYEGIEAVQQQHLSGFQAALTIFGDTSSGAFAGLTVTTSPGSALAGFDLGLAQVEAHQALGQNVTQESAFNTITGDMLGMAGLEGAFNKLAGPEAPPWVGGKVLPKGDYSGPWVNDAITGTVEEGGPFYQTLPDSCASASGSALTGGVVSEADIVKEINQGADIDLLRNTLNADPWGASPGTYGGGYLPDPPQGAVIMASRGPIAAQLKAFGGRAHVVLIEPGDGGTFNVSDPIPQGVGSTYQVNADWILKYVEGAIWKN